MYYAIYRKQKSIGLMPWEVRDEWYSTPWVDTPQEAYRMAHKDLGNHIEVIDYSGKVVCVTFI